MKRLEGGLQSCCSNKKRVCQELPLVQVIETLCGTWQKENGGEVNWHNNKKEKKENQEKKETKYKVILRILYGFAKDWSGKNVYQVKGLSLVAINWDTLRTRKLKMEAWSNDTKKRLQIIKGNNSNN